MLAICGKGKGAETTEVTNNGLFLNTLKTLFELSRVLLDKKCILSGTTKFLSVLSSLANWRSFQNLRGLQYYFPESFRCNLKLYKGENSFDSSLHYFFESENARFLFLRNIA